MFRPYLERSLNKQARLLTFVPIGYLCNIIPFDFQQVASILRQAGQDSIRLVVARPVDPSVPQFALNSTIVPTKVLTDPQGTVLQNQ